MKVRITERDSSLPHQINLMLVKGSSGLTQVCCNCKAGPLGIISNASDPWAIYNNPELHDNSVVEFLPRAHHDQGVKVYELE